MGVGWCVGAAAALWRLSCGSRPVRDGCRVRVQVRAVKRISIEAAPLVLTVHLKRFEYGGFGNKINKPVRPRARPPACMHARTHLGGGPQGWASCAAISAGQP
jgi:hypothetical protein